MYKKREAAAPVPTYDPNDFQPEPIYEPDEAPNPKSRVVPNKAKFEELSAAFAAMHLTEPTEKVSFVRSILGKPMPQNDEEVDKVITAIEALTETN